MWQTTEHVASPWPLTRKPFPYLPLLGQTDGPETQWPQTTGALLCEWSITSEKVMQGSDQRQVTLDLPVQAWGCGIWKGCVRPLIRLSLMERWQIRAIQMLVKYEDCTDLLTLICTSYLFERKMVSIQSYWLTSGTSCIPVWPLEGRIWIPKQTQGNKHQYKLSTNEIRFFSYGGEMKQHWWSHWSSLVRHIWRMRLTYYSTKLAWLIEKHTVKSSVDPCYRSSLSLSLNEGRTALWLQVTTLHLVYIKYEWNLQWNEEKHSIIDDHYSKAKSMQTEESWLQPPEWTRRSDEWQVKISPLSYSLLSLLRKP